MTQTDISPSLIARVTQAARYVISGVTPDSWFGPMQPLQPMAPADVAGRRFDYPTGYNLTSTPRAYEAITFDDLRALADNCDVLRSVIETRKDQMEALEWTVRVVQPEGGRAQVSASDDQKRRIDAIKAFLCHPDKEHSFAQWLRQLLEDMFVLDAACLYKRRTVTGELYALEVMDGATIKILLDDGGRLPVAPDPAYQQVLKGVPAADYTREELMYLKHNPRSHKVYGYSHVEQVLVTVNILIRRAMHQLEYYREGSQPDAFIGLPKEWNQDQIVAFQKHFDAMLSGNLGLRRRLRFMPGDFKYQETKAPPLKDQYDDYLARIICFVFSISAEPFISHINRATAESSQSRAIDEGLAPLMRYVRGIMNRIIACEFASPDLEFIWQDNRAQDPKEAAQIDVAYVGAGILTVNEVRANMGLGPLNPMQTPQPAAQKKVGIDISKFNPNHDERGRFTTADNAVTGGSSDAASLLSTLRQHPANGQEMQVTADDGVQSDTVNSWGNLKTLSEHYEDHGSDFGAVSQEDYADKANQFLQLSREQKFPTKITNKGITRTYDPETNTFGSYNPDDSTKTFMKPDEGKTYFDKQVGKLVDWNKLPDTNEILPENSSVAGGGGIPVLGDIEIPHRYGIRTQTRPDE